MKLKIIKRSRSKAQGTLYFKLGVGSSGTSIILTMYRRRQGLDETAPLEAVNLLVIQESIPNKIGLSRAQITNAASWGVDVTEESRIKLLR